ncbi:c-type cytochrome [Thioclava sp. A2]|uniref:c-type cytochrome n=1 Tax=Thioclava sp. FCG-A2 TaxID=3080562 RepID=UPI0029534DC5|nr:c-type cytochrome [Thioclava sp. A2]MDV7269735.1 c-type cytochrome [Thioclava sp. A2]
MNKMIMAIALGFVLAGTASANVFDRVKVEAGETLFRTECHRCHAVDATDPSYGPLLDGILGRKAGTYEGYEFSEALKGAGFVWTAGALRAWMEENDAFVPGTKMRHVGITDPTVQDFIIEYLSTLAK